MNYENQVERFAITITLGNAAMQDHIDVAAALRDVADRVLRMDGGHGNIRDRNGNTVGSFGFVNERVTA